MSCSTITNLEIAFHDLRNVSLQNYIKRHFSFNPKSASRLNYARWGKPKLRACADFTLLKTYNIKILQSPVRIRVRCLLSLTLQYYYKEFPNIIRKHNSFISYVLGTSFSLWPQAIQVNPKPPICHKYFVKSTPPIVVNTCMHSMYVQHNCT